MVEADYIADWQERLTVIAKRKLNFGRQNERHNPIRLRIRLRVRGVCGDGAVMSDSKRPVKCPNLAKGIECCVCGGSYICLEPWRKKRTYIERRIARKEYAKKGPLK